MRTAASAFPFPSPPGVLTLRTLAELALVISRVGAAGAVLGQEGFPCSSGGITFVCTREAGGLRQDPARKAK